jgi:16S rRNA (cytidine1402-2'-O)-methyltransferase
VVRQGPAKPLSPVRIWVPPKSFILGKSMLSIIPTPIGNLKDITLRCLESLQACDYILCEDTRKTGFLLHHFEISKKLIPFHKHNEKSLEETVLADIENGKNICLVSDAGTPSINDPGAFLIRACHDKGYLVHSLPGPSAIPTALALSGLTYNKFQFLGFFPKKQSEQLALIKEILIYEGLSLFFESPKRIMKTISLFPDGAVIHIAKELSKIHEAFISTSKENATLFEDKLTRGELCVIVEGKKAELVKLDLEDAALMSLLTKHVSTRDAVKIASALTGKKKQAFYK